jgi:hypothetical protein
MRLSNSNHEFPDAFRRSLGAVNEARPLQLK